MKYILLFISAIIVCVFIMVNLLQTNTGRNMEKSDFDKSLEFVLDVEKGYVKHPKHAGGETNMGISKKYNPDVDVKNITPEEAKRIYKNKYWNNSNAQNYQWPDNLVLFDTAVLMGPRTANIIASKAKDWMHYLDLRREIIKAKPPEKRQFIKGWLARTDRLEQSIKNSLHPIEEEYKGSR